MPLSFWPRAAFVSTLAGIIAGPATTAYAQGSQTAPVPQTAPAPAPADTPDEPRPSNRFRFGPEVGVFFLSDGKARDAFGSNFVNYGIGLGNVPRARGRGDWSFDAAVFSSGRRRGSRALIIPVGVSYRIGLGKPDASVGPYAGASANLFITDLRSDKYNVGGGVRATGGGSVFTGLTFGDRAYIQARYYGIGPVRGLNLSGLNVSSGFRF